MSNDQFQGEDKRPHVDTHVCGKCRIKFERGHRIVQVHIFSHKGANPLDLGNVGAHVFDEYEFMHADCEDVFLKKGRRLVV